MLIYNAKIKTMTSPDIEVGYVLTEGNKIKAVGDMSHCPPPTDADIDASGCTVYPGFIDAHTHIGVFGNALGFEAMDANEITDPVTPHLRAIDAINPNDHCFTEAVQAGITTVATGVGSANPIGGSMVAMKTYGSRRVDNRVIKSPIAIKMAFGENPKNCYHDRDEAPTTRMAIAAAIREQLSKAKRYLQDLDEYNKGKDSDSELSPPEFDAKCEALLPLLRKEIMAHIHCHRADDIFTAIRIAKEYDFDYVLIHATEGALIADELAEEKAKMVIGPILCDRSKPELAHLDIRNPSKLFAAGNRFALCTDHSVIPIQYLPLCAGLLIRGGLEEEEALRAITINAAELLGLSDKIGSIEVGKDADLVLFDEVFYSVTAVPKLVIAGGKCVFGKEQINENA